MENVLEYGSEKKTVHYGGNDDKTKSHKYNLDNRVFIVTPVYRDNGENPKNILIKLMREEAQVKNAKH